MLDSHGQHCGKNFKVYNLVSHCMAYLLIDSSIFSTRRTSSSLHPGHKPQAQYAVKHAP